MRVSSRYIRDDAVTLEIYNSMTYPKQTVTHGGSASIPSDPVRPGYIFAGWDKDAKGITENTTVKAKWVAERVITFNSLAGTQYYAGYPHQREVVTISSYQMVLGNGLPIMLGREFPLGGLMFNPGAIALANRVWPCSADVFTDPSTNANYYIGQNLSSTTTTLIQKYENQQNGVVSDSLSSCRGGSGGK